jgi:uncharacterized surface protein with fasciclin (FAS1) repeats
MSQKNHIRTATIAGGISVLLAASAVAVPLAFAGTVMNPPKHNIVVIASGNKNFSTLVTAIKAAGLVTTLEGKGPFTVFAPTNAAFANVPKATLKKLLEPKNKSALVSVLTYHVVAGAVKAAQVVTLKSVKTVNGQSVTITLKKGSVYLNGNAKVIQTNIIASNGVIHVINNVLIPKGLMLK